MFNVGGRVFHKTYGAGTIEAVDCAGICMVKFDKANTLLHTRNNNINCYGWFSSCDLELIVNNSCRWLYNSRRDVYICSKCGHQRTREDLELSLYKGCPACRYCKGENMDTKGRISKKYIVVETLCWQVEADNMEEAREKNALSREKVGKLCSRDFDVRAQIGREMEKFLSEVIDNDN